MSITYTTYTSQIANLAVISSGDANFQTMLPGAIDFAEQKVYRELNLLATVVRDQSATLTANSRTFNLPSTLGSFVTVQGINVFTPVATTTTRNPLQSAWRPYIDFLYPTETSSGVGSVPSVYAMIDFDTIIVGPPPGAAFTVEVVGTIRPTPLSSGNSSTYLTQNLPDLFVAASMIFVSGYMRDFGMQADNPAQSQSWQNQYDKLFASANAEEIRKKYNQMIESKKQ